LKMASHESEELGRALAALADAPDISDQTVGCSALHKFLDANMHKLRWRRSKGSKGTNGRWLFWGS
jgi:hypothetical protein